MVAKRRRVSVLFVSEQLEMRCNTEQSCAVELQVCISSLPFVGTRQPALQGLD